MNPHPVPARALTMVELLAVLVVLAALAAVAMPQYQEFRQRAQVASVEADLQSIAASHRRYYNDCGQFPGRYEAAATVPAGLELFFEHRILERPTPVGGRYSLDGDAMGPGTVSFSIVDVEREATAAVMRQVDAKIDDGDLDSGSLRWTWSRWSYFVQGR